MDKDVFWKIQEHEHRGEFKALGWYTIIQWTELCPECGVRRGGTPGYYTHWCREMSDDEARVREVHGGTETPQGET